MAITSATKYKKNSHKWHKQQPQWQQHLPPTKHYGNNISQQEYGNNICQKYKTVAKISATKKNGNNICHMKNNNWLTSANIHA